MLRKIRYPVGEGRMMTITTKQKVFNDQLIVTEISSYYIEKLNIQRTEVMVTNVKKEVAIWKEVDYAEHKFIEREYDLSWMLP